MAELIREIESADLPKLKEVLNNVFKDGGGIPRYPAPWWHDKSFLQDYKRRWA